MSNNTNILVNFWRLLKSAEISKWLIFLSCSLIACASIFQLLGLGLVVPVLNSLVDETSFKGIRTAPVLGKFISSLPIEQDNTNIFLVMILLIFLAVVLENLCLFIGRYYTTKINEKLTTSVRIKLFSKLIHLSREYFDMRTLAEINSLIVLRNTSLVSLTNYISMFCIFAFFAVVYLVMMLVISWKLTLCSMILLPITHIFAQKISSKIQTSANKEMSEVLEISDKVDEVFKNISLVQLHNNENSEINRFTKNVEAAGRHGSSVRIKSFLVPSVLDVINAFGSLLIVALSIVLFFTYSSYSLGRLLVFFISLRRFTSTVQQLSSTWVCGVAEAPAVQSIVDEMYADYPTITSGALEYQSIKDGIYFKNVSFGYNSNEQKLIKDLSIKIPANKITALVGTTGSGKSTIINLLARFYQPNEGQILYDQINVSAFDLKLLRSKIAIVSQSELLFNTSFKENITYGLDTYDESVYRKALEDAQLVETINRLPQKDLTIIGSQGIRLSGGERQRIQIARAIMKNPEILILDEATSSLDAMTESEFELALSHIIPNKTVIIIAHRINTVRKADLIYFVESGSIIESGNYEELQLKRGKFFEYCKLQNLS